MPAGRDHRDIRSRAASSSSSEASHEDDNARASRSWHDDAGEEDGEEQNDSKKRRRPMSVSCESCKLRKVKCDRGQPACGWCARNDQACEYKERKKPGLRAGYGKGLEARLGQLEAIIRTQQQAIDKLSRRSPGPTSFPERTATQVLNIASDSSAPRAAGQSSLAIVDTEETLNEASAPDAAGFNTNPGSFDTQYPRPEHDTASSPSTLSKGQQVFYDTLDGPVAVPRLSVPDPPISTPLVNPELPPHDLLYDLVNIFFKTINLWAPILHRKTTLDTLFGPTNFEEADRVLLHAIVAATLRYSTDPRLQPDSRERYYTFSRQRVLLYGVDNTSVKALQALVILAIDTCGSSNGPPGWNLLALICRSAVQLGISVEGIQPAGIPRSLGVYTLRANFLSAPTTFIEEESRRRLFWMIYILDRFSTLPTAHSFALDDADINRRLPCHDEFFFRNQTVETRWFVVNDFADRLSDKGENLGVFSYTVEIIALLSKIYRFINKPVDINNQKDVDIWRKEYLEHNAELGAWKHSLPEEYRNMLSYFEPSNNAYRTINGGWVMFHVTYHITLMRLHSLSAYPSRRSPLFTPSLSASKLCIASIESISALCSYVREAGLFSKLGPIFAFGLWASARCLLVHSTSIDQQIHPQFHVLLSTLHEVGRYWEVANRYASVLQRVMDEFTESEVEAVTNSNGKRVTPSSVKIITDMRRCAYDLDWLIRRQPQQQIIPNHKGITQPRVPVQSEFEYLDLFDFFNMPRMPITADPGALTDDGLGQTIQAFGDPDATNDHGMNTANFLYNPSGDWFHTAGI